MNGRVAKAWTRRSRVQLSKALQELLLDAVANNITELPRSHQEQPPDAAPVQARKRRLDATESDSSPAKRARITRTETQQPDAEDEEAEPIDKTTLEQPKPNPPQRLYASFLKDFVDPVDPCSRPTSILPVISAWLESVGLDREECCRSDSYLQHSDSEPFPRQLTRSAPEMYKQDADGFALPPTPPSTGYRAPHAASVAPSDATGTGSVRSSAASLVEGRLYRELNLASNNIFMRNPYEEFPDHVANLVYDVGKDRDSPGPSPDQLRYDAGLHQLEMAGLDEPNVEKYFHAHIFPDPEPLDNLNRADRQPMAKHTVPSTGSKLKVSNPVPDSLYGYNRHPAFPQQRAQLISMESEPVANGQGLLYPFFVIEFKGNGGDLWVATNQCLGGSMSCVNIAERLNEQLRLCRSDKIRTVNSAAFSIAMNGTEARLYISWKHDELDYYMQKVDSFLLQKPKDYLEFRKYVRNIIDWGKEKRLKEIRNSLDSLLEESRQRASEGAKSRQRPSDGSGTSSSKKHKSSSSRADNSRINSVQGQNSEANKLREPYERTSQHTYAPLSCPPFASSTSSSMSSFSHADSHSLHGLAKDRVDLDTSFMQPARSAASVDDQPIAALDNYWIWSDRCKRFYHLNKDGSCEWYKKS